MFAGFLWFFRGEDCGGFVVSYGEFVVGVMSSKLYMPMSKRN